MNRSNELSSIKEMNTTEVDGGSIAACVILGISFLVGAPGNLLVIWTILRHIKQRSQTVVLILHLAVADLLVLITLPVWIYSLLHTWVLGEVFCKGLVYIINVCMFSSIFFITLMSVERCLAICYPFLMMRCKSSTNTNHILILWIVALLLGIPSLSTQTLDETDGIEQCLSQEYTSMAQAIILLCLETLGGFVVPLIILIICYCLVAAKLRKMSFNSKHKSLILVHAVVIAFVVCWLPYHIINITNLVCIFGISMEQECVPESLIWCSGALVFISSSVNPVLYTLFSRNFRGSFTTSRLVKLFQEMAAQTNKLKELVVSPQSTQVAANTKSEPMSL